MSGYQMLYLPLLSTLLLNACLTVTSSEFSSSTEADRQQVSSFIAADAQNTDTKLLKRKVAIARFVDETRHGNAFVLDQNDDRVGKQAMEILSARLTETGRFQMLERTELDNIHSAQQLDGISREQVGADFVIAGAISEFGRSAESEVGIFSRNKIQIARAKVKLRLLDVRTGQIIYTEDGTGEASAEANPASGVGQRAGYDASLDARAISAAISQLFKNLVNSLLDQPWRAYLVGRQDDLYLVSGGTSQGLVIGDGFDVMKTGRTLKSPQTGLLLELPGEKVAEMKVSAFTGNGDNEIALAELTSGDLPENADGLDTYYVLSRKER